MTPYRNFVIYNLQVDEEALLLVIILQLILVGLLKGVRVESNIRGNILLGLPSSKFLFMIFPYTHVL